MEEYRYEFRVIDYADYNSHADVLFWYFTDSSYCSTSPVGHFDKRRFPSGTIVLCRLRKGEYHTGKEGYFMEGFAKVTKFSEDGRPVKFGDSLSNRYLGHWEPPGPKEIIYDKRIKKEIKEIK